MAAGLDRHANDFLVGFDELVSQRHGHLDGAFHGHCRLDDLLQTGLSGKSCEGGRIPLTNGVNSARRALCDKVGKAGLVCLRRILGFGLVLLGHVIGGLDIHRGSYG